VSKVTYFQDLLTAIFERGASAVRHDDGRTLAALAQALMSEKGEVSSQKLSAALLDRIDASNEAQRLEFFKLLATEYDVATDQIVSAAQNYQRNPTQQNYVALRDVSPPRRQVLLRRVNSMPGATERLVKIRTALLSLLPEYPELGRVDLDFEHSFSSWFNRGFLVMRPVNWQSPAQLLEKIIAYEAVHTINDWDDLRRRLQPADRRCFAFFHPAMPEEPLIFVQVALTGKIPGSIHEVLAEDREPITAEQANTAVFYSISNCQHGLRGVSFGNFLIKQVVSDLAETLPNLKTFVTLSPVPGFIDWVRDTRANDAAPELQSALSMAESIADGGPVDLSGAQRDQVMGLVAHYLSDAKRDDNLPVDPVSRFHLNNGASLERVHWMADASAKGLKQAAGIMVNYLYDPKKIEENHEEYVRENRVLISRAVRGLLPKETRRKAASDIT
jgi:malonyl-CoA decarboxylase